jgi:hypothetical protein
VKSKRKQTSAGQRIIQGLTELAEALERREPLTNRFTVRTLNRHRAEELTRSSRVSSTPGSER